MSPAPVSPSVLADGRNNSDLCRRPVSGLVSDAIDTTRAEAGEKSIRFVTDVPRGLEVDVHPELFPWALSRLVQHAVAASPSGGAVHVTAVDIGGAVDVEIADNGPGLPGGPKASLADLTVVYDDGSGASLAWIDHIAQRHGGRSFVMNCPDGGAAYTLRIAKPSTAGGWARAA